MLLRCDKQWKLCFLLTTLVSILLASKTWSRNPFITTQIACFSFYSGSEFLFFFTQFKALIFRRYLLSTSDLTSVSSLIRVKAFFLVTTFACCLRDSISFVPYLILNSCSLLSSNDRWCTHRGKRFKHRRKGWRIIVSWQSSRNFGDKRILGQRISRNCFHSTCCFNIRQSLQVLVFVPHQLTQRVESLSSLSVIIYTLFVTPIS